MIPYGKKKLKHKTPWYAVNDFVSHGSARMRHKKLTASLVRQDTDVKEHATTIDTSTYTE